MELLTLLKAFLLFGSICYLFSIISAIRRHLPRIEWKKKKKEKKEKVKNESGEADS